MYYYYYNIYIYIISLLITHDRRDFLVRRRDSAALRDVPTTRRRNSANLKQNAVRTSFVHILLCYYTSLMREYRQYHIGMCLAIVLYWSHPSKH